MTVPTVGHSFVNPSVYFRPMAQPISNRPARVRMSQGMVSPSRRAPLLRGLSLAHGFEQDDAGGDGHVEAFHVAGHRDPREAVAVFAGQPAQAFALAAQYQRDVAGQVERV